MKKIFLILFFGLVFSNIGIGAISFDVRSIMGGVHKVHTDKADMTVRELKDLLLHKDGFGIGQVMVNSTLGRDDQRFVADFNVARLGQIRFVPAALIREGFAPAPSREDREAELRREREVELRSELNLLVSERRVLDRRILAKERELEAVLASAGGEGKV